MYYICDYQTQRAISGPYADNFKAAAVITAKPMAEQVKFCTMSRYLLAKHGIYPATKEGNDNLAQDLQAATPTHQPVRNSAPESIKFEQLSLFALEANGL